jgi:hypothetical protein
LYGLMTQTVSWHRLLVFQGYFLSEQ